MTRRQGDGKPEFVLNEETGRTFKDFQRAHDPNYRLEDVHVVLRRDLPKFKTAIVVAAQNATPVEETWWQVLLAIAAHRKAEIFVVPLRYKNPTSHWSGSQQNAEAWAKPVQPYLWNVRHALNKNLTLLADIKIQPTAESPLNGAEGISHAASGIIGHTKLQLKTVPTPQSRMAKILTTTGAVTVPNYTDSRSGRMGEFHHSYSAVLVELDGERFNLRQLHYDKKTKSCTDLATRYTSEGKATRAPRAKALGMGDTHVDAIDPSVEAATFGKDGIIQTLNPEYLVWADLLDGYSCNPHHEGDPFIAAAKYDSGRDDVRAEVARAIEFVRARTPPGQHSVVQACNHNDFLRRWINKTDWKRDPCNSDFYLETALIMRRGARITTKGTEYPDPFAHWFRAAKVAHSQVLDLDESFALGGVEMGMHGDIGPNGARGSIRNLRRIGTKSIIFHSHRPGIDEGCYQAGTSTHLKLEYNHGASGWLNAHVSLNADDKRQLIVIVDGNWRA